MTLFKKKIPDYYVMITLSGNIITSISYNETY